MAKLSFVGDGFDRMCLVEAGAGCSSSPCVPACLKEVCMHHSVDMSLDAFCAWLCVREHEVVGCPGTCFHSPLALWLSERFGHVYGVDGHVYGRALHDYCVWRLLPRWAVAFAARTEARAAHVLTGQEAFALLANVERMLMPRGRRSQVADGSTA